MMTTYISLLRGVNVSGHNPIKMEALRMSYHNLGFSDVTTYVQSGNVIFSGNDLEINPLNLLISQKIEKEFGFKVPVIVMSADSLTEIINNNPLLGQIHKDRSFFHVTFLSDAPKEFDISAIDSKKQKEEEVYFLNNAIYLYCPNGYGTTKLTNNFFESKLKLTATTRNWKTTNELLKIALQLQLNIN